MVYAALAKDDAAWPKAPYDVLQDGTRNTKAICASFYPTTYGTKGFLDNAPNGSRVGQASVWISGDPAVAAQTAIDWWKFLRAKTHEKTGFFQ